MKIHYTLPDSEAYRAERARHPLCLAIGVFDGFHLGHQALIRRLLHDRRAGERTGILTFAQHPAVTLRPAEVPPQIATTAERINAFANAGVDEAFVLTFDDVFAAQRPEAFLQRIVDALGVRAIVVGEQFRFGAQRAGDVDLARAFLARTNRTVVSVPNALVDGERVSSTRIRAAIDAGDLATADRLLGQSYTVRGIVVFGAGRGHDLGFPTANLAVDPAKMLPPDGVYAIVGRVDGRDHPGLVSIGTNPTFDGRTRTVEAWLLDFHRSIYGEEIALRDFRFVREQKRFASVDDLLAQMREDLNAVPFPSFTTG